MSFISIEFLVFFIAVTGIGKLIQKFSTPKAFRIFLLIANYAFYSFWDYRFSILLFIMTVIVYCCSLHLQKKLFYYLGLCVPLLTLAIFKYLDFFLSVVKLDPIGIILPMGISFYTFEAISYIVDVSRKKIEAEKSFLNFAVYLSFFPNIVSGPIVRAGDLLGQLKENRKINADDIQIGIQIMLLGYFKKMVIADRLALFVNDVYHAPKAFSWMTILLAVFSYSLQIYMDFSGYSDIAIGCAKCLGFDLKKNFAFPYLSNSISQFWRRWHISLSSWFRDYVYIPLGGNRKGISRQLLNTLIVMCLSGFWHGADWTYLFWGFLNGLLICAEKLFQGNKRNAGFLSVITTFILISLTWVFFRADSFDNALVILKAILTFQKGIQQPYLWSFFAFFVALVYLFIIRKQKEQGKLYGDSYYLLDLHTVKGLTLFFIFAGLLIILAYTDTNPFVYFQF